MCGCVFLVQFQALASKYRKENVKKKERNLKSELPRSKLNDVKERNKKKNHIKGVQNNRREKKLIRVNRKSQRGRPTAYIHEGRRSGISSGGNYISSSNAERKKKEKEGKKKRRKIRSGKTGKRLMADRPRV